jgi:hypothetical protein
MNTTYEEECILLELDFSSDYMVNNIQEFLSKYPKIRGDNSFFLNKCDAISILFQNFLKAKNIKSKVIIGTNLNFNNISWITQPTLVVSKNIEKKKRTSHAVVLIDNIVYDLSSKQFYPGAYSIYSLKEFSKRWVTDKDINSVNYTSSMKSDLERTLRELNLISQKKIILPIVELTTIGSINDINNSSY